MYIVLIVLIFIAAALIILAVLAQNPKGGMAANFGVSNQVMGVRQTSDFLEKFTWGLAVAILVLSIGATMFIPKSSIEASKTGLEKAIQQNAETNVLPNLAIPGTGSEAPAEDAPADGGATEQAE